jgi:hypothetical protein
MHGMENIYKKKIQFIASVANMMHVFCDVTPCRLVDFGAVAGGGGVDERRVPYQCGGRDSNRSQGFHIFFGILESVINCQFRNSIPGIFIKNIRIQNGWFVSEVTLGLLLLIVIDIERIDIYRSALILCYKMFHISLSPYSTHY